MGEAREEIEAAGGQIVAVFQYPGDQVREFCDGEDVAFDCLGDPQIEAYRAVGLGKGSFGEYLGAKIIGPTVKAAVKGHFVGDPKGGYVSLQPATFVVDREGRVAYAHYNDDAADNAPTHEVVEAVRRTGEAA